MSKELSFDEFYTSGLGQNVIARRQTPWPQKSG